jgi:hypothetical protein
MATEFLVRSVNAGSDEYFFNELVRATARPAEAKLLHQFGREPDGRPSRPWGWRDLPQPSDASMFVKDPAEGSSTG